MKNHHPQSSAYVAPGAEAPGVEPSWERRMRHDRIEGQQESSYEFMTRILNLVVASLAIVLLAPIMIAIALLIRLKSPGPILFKQVRIGKNRRRRKAGVEPGSERRNEDRFGKPFVIYKFRTMQWDSREKFPELYRYQYSEKELHSLPIKVLVGHKEAAREGGRKSIDEKEWAEDPRVTWTGRWLRRTSLDELPNFFNVLKGDMHLVGPRPDIVENIRYYSERHLQKLNVRPGITGLAQVMGRGKLSFYQTNEYDVEYVRKRSLWYDLKILARTIPGALRATGAF